MDVGLGYTIFMPETEDILQTFNNTPPPIEPPEIVSSQGYHQPSPTETLDIFRPDIADAPSIPSSLSPPLTYSFQETSIARRIHRACVEAAYHLIHDPRRRPTDFERIFKLSLLGRDRS